MEERDLNQMLAGKQHRRHELARLPIEEKLRAVVRLQQMAAPILRQRGEDRPLLACRTISNLRGRTMKLPRQINPRTELAGAAARALKRAAKRAHAVARQYGTPIHVQSNGTVVALKP